MYGKSGTHPHSKAAFIARLQQLGYTVELQGEIIATALGTIVAQAEEIAALDERVKKIENRQLTAFRG